LSVSIEACLLLFTDRGSTGLLTMCVIDFTFAVWLGLTIGFGGVEKGNLDLEKKQK
jgi:hypothetical protein